MTGHVDLVVAQQAVRTLQCPNCSASVGPCGRGPGLSKAFEHAGRWTRALLEQLVTDAAYTAALSTVGEIGPVMAGTMIPEFTAGQTWAEPLPCVRCGTTSHEVGSGVRPGDQLTCTSESACAIRVAWNAAGRRCTTCGCAGSQPTHHHRCDDGRDYRIAVLTPGQMETALLYLAGKFPDTTDEALALIDVLRLAPAGPAPEGGPA